MSPIKSLPRRKHQLLAPLTGNRLDSSVLVHKRGKERTKKKKPTLLKRVILRERAERRRRAGLELGTAALLAGLTVKEETSDADGQQGKQEASEAGLTAEGGPAVEQSGTVPAQVAEAAKSVAADASVVKQGTTPPKQGAAASQRRTSESALQIPVAGGVQQTPPVSEQKVTVILKRESVSPLSSQVDSNSTPGSVQKAAVTIKQEPVSSGSQQKVTPETKTAWGTTNSTHNSVKVKQEAVSPVKVKHEPVSPISPENAVLEVKPLATSTPDSTHDATADLKQEGTPKQEDEKPPDTTPVSDIKDSKPADGGDSDDDAPPSRGPDYTPTVTVDPKVLIHSRKFREYCQQTLSPDIDESARLLLQDLTRFQDRLYNRDPIKARSRRRLVFGLREVSKHLAIKKLACVILAPNIEKIETAGGLDQAVQRLLTLASEREVPLVFALKRRALGHACKKPVPVSCVGIFNYQGSEDNYKRMMQLTEAAQERYRAMVAEVERALQPAPVQEQLSPAEQLLGVIDGISKQRPPPPPVSEGAADDPTHSLLAKLRSVTLGSPVSG